MKAFILLSSLLVFLAIVSHTASAVDITFTSSGTIQDGDSYAWVSVHNDGTVVNMRGGEVVKVITNDQCIFNFLGGNISSMDINVLGTMNVAGGNFDGGILLNGGTAGKTYLNISDGSFECNYSKLYPNSVTTITGGNVHFSGINLMGELSISSGFVIIDDTSIGYDPIVTIYGYGFHFDPLGGSYPDEGLLTGYLLDGNSFSFNNVSQWEYSHFQLVPEPTGMILFTAGLLFLRKKKTSSYKIRKA